MSVTPQHDYLGQNSFFAAEMHDDADLMSVEGDDFVDAPEHQDVEDQVMEDGEHKLGDNTDSNNVNYSTHAAPSFPIVGEKGDDGIDGFEMDAEPDVEQPIESSYQRLAPRALYNPANETPVVSDVNKSAGADKYRAAYEKAMSRTSSGQGQHSAGCSGARGASTPPATPPLESKSGPASQKDIKLETKSGSGSQPDVKPEFKITEPVWEGPDELRDVARALKCHQRRHEKTLPLIPQLPVPLPPHRYWIGVLNPGRRWDTATKESHFTWMKGNRLTTVETVRKIYAATTMMEGVFITGEEKPEDTDRMEELDYFNDKVVLFSVLTEGQEGSAGRLLTQGLVTKEIEIIELDD